MRVLEAREEKNRLGRGIMGEGMIGQVVIGYSKV